MEGGHGGESVVVHCKFYWQNTCFLVPWQRVGQFILTLSHGQCQLLQYTCCAVCFVMMLMVEGDCDGSMMCHTCVVIASTCEWCAGGGESTGEAASEDCPIPGHTWGSGQHLSG